MIELTKYEGELTKPRVELNSKRRRKKVAYTEGTCEQSCHCERSNL
jgi:hypothetical protein